MRCWSDQQRTEVGEPQGVPEPIPGYDFAGYVVSAPHSSPFKPGSQVYGRTSIRRTGNARSYSIALLDELGMKPKNLSWELAATVPASALVNPAPIRPAFPFILLPVSFSVLPFFPWQAAAPHFSLCLLTRCWLASAQAAYQALFEYLGFKPPKAWGPRYSCAQNGSRKVFIMGGASSVGMWMVQFAKLAGVGHIAATCGSANIDFVKSLGAHEVLDYTKPEGNLMQWPSSRSRFDVVVDCVGGSALRGGWMVVREGGHLLSVVTPPECMKPVGGVAKDIKRHFFVQVAGQLSNGDHHVSAREWPGQDHWCEGIPLEGFQAAMEEANTGKSRGKVVLNVNRQDPRPLIELLER